MKKYNVLGRWSTIKMPYYNFEFIMNEAFYNYKDDPSFTNGLPVYKTSNVKLPNNFISLRDHLHIVRVAINNEYVLVTSAISLSNDYDNLMCYEEMEDILKTHNPEYLKRILS